MKKAYSTLLKDLDLPQEIKDGIGSRSSMLSATLKTISEEDLVQEGLVTVYSVIRKKPDAPLPFIMKAINNKYSNIRKKEVQYKKRFASQSLYSDNTERELDIRAYQEFQKNLKAKPIKRISIDDMLAGSGKGIVEPVLIMKEMGMTFKEIAEYLGKDTKTIRNILRERRAAYEKNDM